MHPLVGALICAVARRLLHLPVSRLVDDYFAMDREEEAEHTGSECTGQTQAGDEHARGDFGYTSPNYIGGRPHDTRQVEGTEVVCHLRSHP